jgi:ribosomal protein L16/L10AE
VLGATENGLATSELRHDTIGTILCRKHELWDRNRVEKGKGNRETLGWMALCAQGVQYGEGHGWRESFLEAISALDRQDRKLGIEKKTRERDITS